MPLDMQAGLVNASEEGSKVPQLYLADWPRKRRMSESECRLVNPWTASLSNANGSLECSNVPRRNASPTCDDRVWLNSAGCSQPYNRHLKSHVWLKEGPFVYKKVSI